MTERSPARAVVDIITGTWRAQALYAAVALRLPDYVAAGHDTSVRLADRAAADPDGIIRLMRLLVALGVFAGNGIEGYRMTSVSELLRVGTPGSMRDMCLLYGEEFHRAWGSSANAVRSGDAGFADAFGRTLHEYLAEEPNAGPRFLRAMNAGSTFFADVPKTYDFSRCRVVADLAGGSGMLLATVLTEVPHLRGLLLDREHMLPAAKEYLESSLDDYRYEVVAGDIFESVPTGPDVYLLSRVLQDWRDDDCVTLLTNVRRAMKDKAARLLVLERVIPEDGSAVLSLLFDLHLLMMAGGGERTLVDYESVLAKAGLRLESVHDLALETSLLVAAPV